MRQQIVLAGVMKVAPLPATRNRTEFYLTHFGDAVEEIPHVRLPNRDALDREQKQTLAARRREVPRAPAIPAQGLDRSRRWWERRSGRHRTQSPQEWRGGPTLPKRNAAGDLAAAGG